MGQHLEDNLGFSIRRRHLFYRYRYHRWSVGTGSLRYHSADATTHSLVLRGQPHLRHQVYTDHCQVSAASLT